ncbi:hypothetical protein COB55_01090 [Candidatus Wolfebacteria bacterium]|nr:MAG: hypothetical protein COB55_01090 [Candidatus Wolfebacteria bacterium]
MNYSKNKVTFYRGVSFAVLLLFLVVFALWLEGLVSGNEAVQGIVYSYGYVGIFFLAIVSGFNIFVPVPIAAFIPVFVSAGLDPWIAVGLIAIGMTIGDSIGFFVGRFGGGIDSRFVKKIQSLYKRFSEKNRKIGMMILFAYVAFVPAPNELVIIPLGIIGCRYRNIFPVILLGNLVLNILVYVGFSGLLLFTKFVLTSLG